MPWCETRVVAVKGNDHNEFGSGSCGSHSEDSEGFGLKVTCNLWVRKNQINIEREGAKSCQEQQAQKMASPSNSRLPAVVGTNVVVRVPDLDRGRLAHRNVLAVVLMSTLVGFICWPRRKAYLSGCMLAMNSQLLTTTSSRHMMCPQSSLSLRSASMITSGSKQGFVSCYCKRHCFDKKCKCLSKNTKCNSKCHSNSSCKNKRASPLFFIRPTSH